MSDQPVAPPRLRTSVCGLLVVNAIISLQVALLLPAIDAARERQGVSPILPPALSSFQSDHPWCCVAGFPVITTVLLGYLIRIARAMLPDRVRRHFVWMHPPKEPSPPPELIDDARPSTASALIAGLSMALLVAVASHVRSDRTYRRPIVTWVGPLADYVREATIAGLFLSVIAFVVGCYACAKTTHRILGLVGPFVAIFNLFGSCVFYGALHED